MNATSFSAKNSTALPKVIEPVSAENNETLTNDLSDDAPTGKNLKTTDVEISSLHSTSSAH